MAGILDDLSSLGSSPLFPGLLSLPPGAAFPDVVPKKKGDAAIWAAIDADTAKENADADRRNAAGLAAARNVAGKQVGPFAAPDQTSPGVTSALGQVTSDFGNFGSPKFISTTPFGSLTPSLPQAQQQPQDTASAVPLPRQRPVAAAQAAPAPAPSPVPPMSADTLPPAVRGARASVDDMERMDVPETSLLGRIGGAISKLNDGIGNHTTALLAAAGGLAGAPSWGTGLSRGFAAAAAALPIDQKLQNQNQTFAALRKRGVSEDDARAAMSNPEILKQVLPQVFGPKQMKFGVISEDALGNKTHGFIDEVGGKAYDLAGNLVRSGSAGAPGSQGASAVEPNYDPMTRRDEAFLGSLDPVTAAAVKDIADGNMSGTGRNLQKLMPYVARYEQGFTTGTYTSRNKFNTELGSQSASTVGGQKVLMGTALGHLGEAAEAAADLGNVNGLGSADVGHAANFVANRTTANAAKANSLNDKVAKFSGEVGKLYSGSSGGGVHEREESRGRLGANLTSAELAAGLESNRDLILSKQQALEQHAVDLFGPEGAKRFDFIGPEGRKSLQKIEKAIATLRGTTPPDAPASLTTGAPLQSGKYTWSPDKGLQHHDHR
jgi:hypothetical protein